MLLIIHQTLKMYFKSVFENFESIRTFENIYQIKEWIKTFIIFKQIVKH